jgi:hypothetical protein
VPAFQPDRIAPSSTAPALGKRASERLKDLGTTLLLTLAAGSLTLNGFLIALALQSRTSPAAAQTVHEPIVPDAPSTIALFSLAGTTAALRSSAAFRPPDVVGRSVGRSPVKSTHGRRVKTEPRARVRTHGHRGSISGTSTTRNRRPLGSVRRTAVAYRAAQALRWKAVTDATYYDVVFWRDGKRFLDLWPVSPPIDFPTAQVNHGSQARLSPGRYLWFVYPGFGAKSSRRYGALAASGVLVVHPKGGTWLVSDSFYPSSPRSPSRASRYRSTQLHKVRTPHLASSRPRTQ